jgi:pyrroline-5-carboxylate reductase
MSDLIEILAERRIGFLGCGAMAQALAGGLCQAGVSTDQLLGADLAAAQREVFEEKLGIKTCGDNAELVAASDVVIVCLKPDVVPVALAALGNTAELGRSLWISLAAGVSIEKIQSALPDGTRIIRTMPNTPALVQAGATALCPNAASSEEDVAIADALFAAVGVTWVTQDESQLDAVTGLSGSGPAYVFLILEALGDAGVRQGLPREAANRLAFQTVMGAAKLAIESGKHPGVLKDQVTSPGGTTIAGLQRLEEAGVRAALYDAVEAATQRSKELGR